MSKILEVGILGLGTVALIALLWAAGLVLNGWALSTMWGWFVVPIFSVRALSITEAYGLVLVTALFKGYTNTKNISTGGWIAIIAKPLVIVFFGWIVQSLFMG